MDACTHCKPTAQRQSNMSETPYLKVKHLTQNSEPICERRKTQVFGKETKGLLKSE